MMDRREFTKRAYIAPLIITLPVAARYAGAGSQTPGDEKAQQWSISTLDPNGTGTGASVFYPQGTYMLMPAGQTYVLKTNWTYLGQYGQATLPPDFPYIVLGAETIVVQPL